MSSERRRIASGSPYEPVIGFSRAVRVGDRLLVSGTAPIWPDGSCDPDPEAQAARCLEIILAALAEAGAGPEHVVRTRMFLVDPADWEAVGRAHGAIFAELRGRERVLQVLEPGRAHDRGGPPRLVQQPGELDLGGGDAPPGRDLGGPVDNGPVEVGPVQRVQEGVGV